jgi:hypothetical protein
MKNPLVIALALTFIVINISACQEKPDEKISKTLTEMSSDKEIQRMNDIQRKGDESVKKLLGK